MLKHFIYLINGTNSQRRVADLVYIYFMITFLRDCCGSFLCACSDIIQGMGFALLAGVPAVYGLYASIFPGWVYYLFGTSRHLSVGTMALTALMVGSAVARTLPGIHAL